MDTLKLLIAAVVFGAVLTLGAGIAAATPSDGKITEDEVKIALQHEVEANRLDDEGNLDGAIKEYEVSLDSNPYSVSCLFNLGYAYLRAERVQEAIYTYERAVTLEPGDAEIYKLLGIAYVQNGEKQKAVMAWEKSLELDPDQPSVKQFIAVNK